MAGILKEFWVRVDAHGEYITESTAGLLEKVEEYPKKINVQVERTDAVGDKPVHAIQETTSKVAQKLRNLQPLKKTFAAVAAS